MDTNILMSNYKTQLIGCVGNNAVPVFIYVPQVSLMLAPKAQFLGHFGLLEQIKIQVFVISPKFSNGFT